MIKDTSCLTPLFYEKEKTRDAEQTILSKFFKGGRVILCGANSPSGLASRPIKILLCDEVDRYPQSASKEGDPISIAMKRLTTYFDAKTAIFSTPTVKGQSRIDMEYELGTQEEWRHVCPGCGSLELLNYRQMICDYDERKDKAGNRTIIVRSVKWKCPTCGNVFEEMTIRRAEQLYVSQNPAALKNGVRSFFINGFASPWLKWTDIMREWLESKGNPFRESVIYNTRFGESYEMPAEVDNTNLLDKLDQYNAQVPDGVLLITAGVDVQKNRLEYAIYGWNAEECYGIKRDIIVGEPSNPATWAELDNRLNETFHFRDGTAIKVARTFIDSGFATDNVYGYCRRRVREGRFAIKGKSVLGASLLHKTNWLKESGVYLITLNVDAGKNEVYSLLESGKMHFGADDEYERRSFDENFFEQLTAEHRVRRYSAGAFREVWEPLSKAKRNEMLDCTCYALAAAKSCISGDEKTFWQERYDDLRGVTIKQPARRSITSRELDVY